MSRRLWGAPSRQNRKSRLVMADEAKRPSRRSWSQLIPHLRAFARTPVQRSDRRPTTWRRRRLTKAWNARDCFEPGTNMKAWTFMILRNQFYSEKRRSWRQRRSTSEMAENTLLAIDDPDGPRWPCCELRGAWPSCRTTSARRLFWSARAAWPMRKPRRSANARSAR